MKLAEVVFAAFLVVGAVTVVAAIVASTSNDAQATAPVLACNGLAQLTAAELQAVQVGNPAVSAQKTFTSTVSVSTSAASSASVAMQEQGGTITTTTTVGTKPCFTDQVAVSPLSLPDNATVARPTPTP